MARRTDRHGNRDIPGIAAGRWLLQCRDDDSSILHASAAAALEMARPRVVPSFDNTGVAGMNHSLLMSS
jgi:hypothetical protein